jgi:5-methylcytosine-specific restriction protein B
MTLREYNHAGDDDHFCRWIEKHTEALGSIWGGSSLKFGIYSRSSTAAKEPSAQRGVMQDANYGWYSKYGATAEEAFAAIKKLIVQTAQAARAGRLDEVESIDLWPIFRRKIAFLYQDREKPCILPIYMGPMLRQVWPGTDAPPKDAVTLYEGFMNRRAGKSVLAYADEILVQVEAAQTRDAASDGDDVLRHFAAANGLIEALQAEAAVEAFVELARGLHQRGLDWWITKAEEVHAGRTEDPEIWSVTVALRLNLANGSVGVQVGEDQTVRPLTADGVAAQIEQAAADFRIKPVTHREPCWPDDYGRGEERLTVALTDAHIRDGRVKVSKLQRLFPATSFCAVGEHPAEAFVLELPNGQRVDEAWVLNDRHRIHPKMGALMAAEQLKPGDYAVISKLGPRHYQLDFAKQGQFGAASKATETPAIAIKPRYSMPPLNQILYGPPGTGKTYSTIDAALEILDPSFLAEHGADRATLKARFDALTRDGRVRFVTFHQSFSYEDFVEGLRAQANDDQQLEYRVEPGVFKRLCDDARPPVMAGPIIVSPNARIWKIAIAGTGPSATKDYCLANDEARIGWGRTGDLKQNPEPGEYYQSLGSGDHGTLRYFADEIAIGDVLLCIHSAYAIAAVGVVTGDYRFEESSLVPKGLIEDYQHVRPVKWLYKNLELPIGPINDDKTFTLKTVYQMHRLRWSDLQAYLESHGNKPDIAPTAGVEALNPYVLIIDEINRGNISRILGELITLIEPSKREGAEEGLETLLPYSKKPFAVPRNVYLIGTMNTADRSLTGMDVALRRRFVFREMPPQPDLLKGIEVEGIAIDQLLAVLNQRIEALLDRDHCLGHAYFMALRENPTMGKLAEIFRSQVLPLLQEYFFDDWQRIQWVLNDHRKHEDFQFVSVRSLDSAVLFGSDVNVSRRPQVWQVNGSAFDREESYMGVIDHREAAG